MVSTRQAYGEALARLGDKYENIVVLDADLAEATKTGIFKNIHYILCGKGKQLDELQNLAKENHVENQVHFLGYRKDVLNIYGQTDLLAFPSMREGLGLAGLEAMHCGLPLVTSNTSGPRDYMENGKTGYMFDPYDANGFAKGIQELYENAELRKTCGKNNQMVVVPYYVDNVKNEVLELIKEF